MMAEPFGEDPRKRPFIDLGGQDQAEPVARQLMHP
jgi:hypothetical protein